MARLPAYLPLLSLCLATVAGAQSPAPPSVPTLRAKTRIVVIDVVVTDKQGNTVKNLKPSDFALAENGTPQTINHFEAHTSLSAEDAAKLPPMPPLDPNIFTNYSPAPANGPLTVLLFDSLDSHDTARSKRMDQSVVEQQLLKYLAIPHPGVRMELFEQNGDLRLLQGFTSDPDLLRAALTNRKKLPQTSMLVDNPLCGSSDTVTTDVRKTFRLDDPDQARAYAEWSGPNECRQAELQVRSISSLRAMAALARYMGSLPGRKNLLWFSTSFPIPANKSAVTDELHKTMALFAKNQVAVYPIGAGGLLLAGPGLDKLDSEAATMDMMAEDTGGKVFAGSNDMAAEVGKAIDHGSNYYTLTYTPTNGDWKGEFRKVEVKLAQAGYTLDYRRGYYADDLDKPTRKLEAKADEVAPAPDPAKVALLTGMEYGSPQPTDIVFKAAVNPRTGQPEPAAARANNLSPKVTGPFERYVLSIAALPTAFTYKRVAPGKIHMGAKLVTCVYTSDGALLNSTTLTIDGDIDDARYQSIMENGLKFQQEVSVPVKGENFLRIGVEDLATHKMGVVEIPVATVAKLKPLEASNTVPK